MEKIQYKAPKIVFNSNEALEDLFLHRHEVSVHQHLRRLTTNIYKSLTDLNPEFIKPFLLFTVKELPYNLRNGPISNLPSA